VPPAADYDGPLDPIQQALVRALVRILLPKLRAELAAEAAARATLPPDGERDDPEAAR
jgi:hypothetical protein